MSASMERREPETGRFRYGSYGLWRVGGTRLVIDNVSDTTPKRRRSMRFLLRCITYIVLLIFGLIE